MNSIIRSTAIAAALLASASFASAQTSPVAPGSSAPSASSSMGQSGALQLSAAQKSNIFKTVTKEKVKTPPPANLRLSVGAQVPASIELYPLPANIVSEVPETKLYKYTIAQNQVVLVDPTNMKIVEIIKQ